MPTARRKGSAQPRSARLRKQLYDEAKKKGWIIISMKNDWARIFSFE